MKLPKRGSGAGVADVVSTHAGEADLVDQSDGLFRATLWRCAGFFAGADEEKRRPTSRRKAAAAMLATDLATNDLPQPCTDQEDALGSGNPKARRRRRCACTTLERFSRPR